MTPFSGSLAQTLVASHTRGKYPPIYMANLLKGLCRGRREDCRHSLNRYRTLSAATPSLNLAEQTAHTPEVLGYEERSFQD